jgi:hypothetical protein
VLVALHYFLPHFPRAHRALREVLSFSLLASLVLVTGFRLPACPADPSWTTFIKRVFIRQLVTLIWILYNNLSPLNTALVYGGIALDVVANFLGPAPAKCAGKVSARSAGYFLICQYVYTELPVGIASLEFDSFSLEWCLSVPSFFSTDAHLFSLYFLFPRTSIPQALTSRLFYDFQHYSVYVMALAYLQLSYAIERRARRDFLRRQLLEWGAQAAAAGGGDDGDSCGAAAKQKAA